MCPVSNNTVYNNGKEFRQFCGIDYSDDGAVDIGNKKVTSFDSCLDFCASWSNCTGAGWGYMSGDTGGKYTCYLKNDLVESHNATNYWAFGVLITDSTTTESKGKKTTTR